MGDWIRKKHSFKDIYKSIVSKRHREKRLNKAKSKTSHSQPTTGSSSELDDDKAESEKSFSISSPSFISRTASKIRSKTPTLGRRKTMSRNISGKGTTPTTPFSRSVSASTRRNSASDVDTSTQSRIFSRRCASAKAWQSPTGSPSADCETSSPSLSRSSSRRSTTPIIFSQSSARTKPPPVEKKLECTLEDLCFGSVKKIKVTRHVIKHPGIIVQEEEILKIEVKPGWRKGTKITFEGKGDENPGHLPADIVFLIDEKEHPVFRRRDGDNLEVSVEIPLVEALTGSSIPVPLIEGETMSLSFEDMVIYHGYQEVIKGKGMPNPKNDGTRGDLHVEFLVIFPKELTQEQREEAVSFLQDCS